MRSVAGRPQAGRQRRPRPQSPATSARPWQTYEHPTPSRLAPFQLLMAAFNRLLVQLAGAVLHFRQDHREGWRVDRWLVGCSRPWADTGAPDCPPQEGDGCRWIPGRADIDGDHLPTVAYRPEDRARDARHLDVCLVDGPAATHPLAMRPCRLLVQGCELLPLACQPRFDAGTMDG